MIASARSMAVVALLLLVAGCVRAQPHITPAGPIELPRMMGRWHVIASIPTRYERGGHNPVETYRLEPDGTICTWFRMRPGGFGSPVKLLHSRASVVPGTGNGEWKVHLFAFLGAQYLVGWIKPDYSQVMVVRDARDYLWYMARTPDVPETDYQGMLARARAMGYDTGRVVRAPQRWPESGADSQTFAGGCP